MRTLYGGHFAFRRISHHGHVLPTVKDIVLTGFGNITLLDLDTIDLSNLNRQFLFRKKDVKQSKALVSVFEYVRDMLDHFINFIGMEIDCCPDRWVIQS